MLRRIFAWILARLTPAHPWSNGGPYRDARFSEAARLERAVDGTVPPTTAVSSVAIGLYALVLLLCVIAGGMGESTTTPGGSCSAPQRTTTHSDAPTESMTMWVSEARESMLWVQVFRLNEQDHCRDIVVRECPMFDDPMVVSMPSFVAAPPASSAH